MNTSRSLTTFSGAALVGLGGALVARAFKPSLRRVEKAFTLERSPAELYDAWHDEQRRAKALPHFGTITIIEEAPGERIAWRSSGPHGNRGVVTFTRAPGNRGTEMRVAATFTAPVFAPDPSLAAENDLRRFKALIEAGDIAINGTDVKA